MRFRTFVLVLASTLLSSCNEELLPPGLDDIAVQLSIVSGGDQIGPVGQELPDPVVVRVTRETGRGNQPVRNYLVNFRVIAGGGSMYAGAALTNSDGVAQDYWTLGAEAGENILEVRSVNPTTGAKRVFGTFTATGVAVGDPATSTITATPASIPPDGVSPSTITVQVKDSGGADLAVGGDNVVLSTTLGSLSGVFDNGNGTYTAILTSGLTLGAATITGTLNGTAMTDAAIVAISSGGATIVVTPAGATISGAGNTTSFTPQFLDSQGNPVGGKTFTWLSLNPNVATVDPNTGLTTAISSGQVAVRAVADGVAGYATLSVSIPNALPVVRWNPEDSGVSADLFAVYGSSSMNIHIVGDTNGGLASTLHWTGSEWQGFASPQAAGELTLPLRTLWITADDLIDDGVWMFGDHGIFGHITAGGGYSIGGTGTSEHRLGAWAASPADVISVGSGGVIRYARGTGFVEWRQTVFFEWIGMQSGVTTSLNAVWGSSLSNIFAVGDGGTIIHFDGVEWSSDISGSTTDLNGIWGSDSGTVYAVGDAGLILRYDGLSWTTVSDGSTTSDLLGVWGTSPSDVYMVGQAGTLLRFDGVVPTSMDSGTTEDLFDIWGSSASDFITVGANGTILRGTR